MATSIWKEWEKCKKYQEKKGYTKFFPYVEKFKAGDQWPAPTKKTKNLPRPVFNITDMFISRKRADIINQNFIVTYRPAESLNSEGEAHAAEGAALYTDYIKVLLEEMEWEDVATEMVDSAASIGTGVIHLYWDNNVYGGHNKRYAGDLRAENIDMLDIGFANPAEKDVQKQKYIIISSRAEIKSIKELAKKRGVSEIEIAKIRSDEARNLYGEEINSEEDENKEITVLTKYYKKNGEVYFDKSTQDVVLIKGQRLTPSELRGESEYDPNTEAEYRDIEKNVDKDDLEEIERDSEKENDNVSDKEVDDYDEAVISRYPVIVMRWKEIKKSIYGRGEAKELINVNKAYNFLKAMQLLTVQNVGWPKTVVKAGTNVNITNEPGEIITETEPNSVRYLHGANPSASVSQIAQELMDMQRTISGVTDVSTGEVTGNMAASAIIALQNQARTPVKEMQKKYFRAIKNLGAICEEFFKTHYSLEKEFEAEDKIGKKSIKSFTGTDYKDVYMKLAIDVGSASEFGEELMMSTLDRMYDKGDINMMEYIELAPANVVPFKERLKRLVDMRNQNQAIKEQEMQDVNSLDGMTDEEIREMIANTGQGELNNGGDDIG